MKSDSDDRPDRGTALAGVLVDGLAAAEAELVALGEELGRCAETVAIGLRQLEGAGLPPGLTASVVSALQAEDHIRQHQEQIALFLSRLRVEVESLAEPNHPETRAAVTARLLKGLPLEAMQSRLAARLAGTAPPPALRAADGGDVELF